jgi:aspartyl-tRNA(Asn)/glutamyl-tRNA(Gln) amidotransferase subunit A
VITVSIPTLKFALPCYYLLACAEASSNLVRYDGIRYGCNDLSSIFNHHSTTHGNGDSMNHNDLHEKNRLLNNYNLLTEYQMDYDQLISKFRALKFGHEVIKRILTGTFILSKNSIQEFFYVTNEIRKQLQYEYSQIFYHNRPIDMILCPTAPTLPYQYSNLPSAKDMLVNDLFTVSSNLIGNPSISLPITTTSAQSDTNKNHTNQPILPIGMQLMTSHHNEVLLFKVALAVEQRVEFFKKIPNHVKTGIVL